jgi:long-chain acyl-CoA synthetase
LSEIVFTSGTTGVPKGVMLTHGNLLAAVQAFNAVFPLKRNYRALSLLPLSHVFEQVVNLLDAYTSGVRMTYLPRLNALTIARVVQEEHTTCMAIVPELLRLLLNGIERRAREEGSWRRWELAHRLAEHLPFPLRRLLFRQVHHALGGRLEFFACGGAPLDVKLAQAWERMGIRIFEGYGLTETCAATTLNTWTDERIGSVGKALPGVDLNVSDTGEILIRGQMVFSGYAANEELTTRAFVDGWFRSGDIGFLDRDGFLHIAGREAFKIVLADGRKVYTEDVERVLNGQPLVKESCVIGLKRNGAETVHAVLLTDSHESVSEIVRDVNQRLEDHQQIVGWTIWSEPDFPRTPMLKVDRELVRAAIQRRQTTASKPLAEGATPTGDPLTALVARVSDRPIADVREDAALEMDLGFDSLGRVELISAIEEEIGVAVDELKVGPHTTVSELRQLLANGSADSNGRAAARWPRAWWARALRPLLQWVAFRLQDRWMDIEVLHPERVDSIPVPSLLVFNYQAPYAGLLVLRALPKSLRSRLAVAADASVWSGASRWKGWLVALVLQAFPFAKTGGEARASLQELSWWLDSGYAVLMAPEGGPEMGDQLLSFFGGMGLMAVEMRVPVVPFTIEDYWRLYPSYEVPFPWLPSRRGRVRVTVGEPIHFSKATSEAEATELVRRALIQSRRAPTGGR